MIYLLNPISLMLGLLAWLLPFRVILRFKNQDHKYWPIYSFVSMSACATSIYLQILYNNHLVNKEDWSAMMDTGGTLAAVSAILLFVAIVLNVIALGLYYRKRNQA